MTENTRLFEPPSLTATRVSYEPDPQEKPSRLSSTPYRVSICSNCQEAWDESGQWNEISNLNPQRGHIKFESAICPDCQENLNRTAKWQLGKNKTAYIGV